MATYCSGSNFRCIIFRFTFGSITSGLGGGGGGSRSAGRGGAAAASNCAQKVSTSDALSYLKVVKDTFQDQREKYDMFIALANDFKNQRFATLATVILIYIQIL